MTPIIIDGKKIKHVAKRLKPTRSVKGTVLGGKTLTALSPVTGMVVAMNAHLDGEVSDAPLMPGLLDQIEQGVDRPVLYIMDRPFCDLTQPAQLLARGAHFLIRYCKKVKFYRDSQREWGHGRDEQGRSFFEEWGSLGTPGHARSHDVRRITLKRPGEEDVILITDLLDAKLHPASDLLAAYLERWGIERVFQKITEVFHLRHLISSAPQGTIFQFAFCLLLYNLIEVMRHHLATAREMKTADISTEKLFYDVHRQLNAWSELVGPWHTLNHYPDGLPAVARRHQLAELLGATWSNRWLKAPSRPRAPSPPAKRIPGAHTSVFRLLNPSHKKKDRSHKE